jgi:hypothetical protein
MKTWTRTVETGVSRIKRFNGGKLTARTFGAQCS